VNLCIHLLLLALIEKYNSASKVIVSALNFFWYNLNFKTPNIASFQAKPKASLIIVKKEFLFKSL